MTTPKQYSQVGVLGCNFVTLKVLDIPGLIPVELESCKVLKRGTNGMCEYVRGSRSPECNCPKSIALINENSYYHNLRQCSLHSCN